MSDESKEAALALVARFPTWFRKDFPEWLADNWAIWEAFDTRAHRLWNVGCKHAGARMIGEVIRYQTALAQKDKAFKVTDWFWPDCARLWMLIHPERKGFFETRLSPASLRAA